jgi:hypothetical protein
MVMFFVKLCSKHSYPSMICALYFEEFRERHISGLSERSDIHQCHNSELNLWVSVNRESLLAHEHLRGDQFEH